MSLDKPPYNNLKSRNYLNLRLNQNNKQKSKIILDSKKRNRYSNENIKNRNNSKYKKYSIDMNIENSLKNNIKSKANNKKLNLNLINNAPLNTNTTRESTLNSAYSKGPKKTKQYINKPSQKNETIAPEEESNKKLKEPENEDIKFLYGIFYNYKQMNDDSDDKNNKINFNDLRKYIIKNEKNFKNEGNILLYQSSRSTGLVLDFYFIKKF